MLQFTTAIMEPVVTVFDLFMFYINVLHNTEEEKLNFDRKTIYKFMTKLDNDLFYLGGHRKMTRNDIINLNMVEETRQICEERFAQYGAANSFELASIREGFNELDFIEKMIKKYNEVIAKG